MSKIEVQLAKIEANTDHIKENTDKNSDKINELDTYVREKFEKGSGKIAKQEKRSLRNWVHIKFLWGMATFIAGVIVTSFTKLMKWW